jgi:hypothetical protein
MIFLMNIYVFNVFWFVFKYFFLMIFMFFQCFSWFFIVLKSFYCDFCNGIIFVFQWFLFFHVIVFFGNGCLLVCFLTCARNKKVVVCCFCLFFFSNLFFKIYVALIFLRFDLVWNVRMFSPMHRNYDSIFQCLHQLFMIFCVCCCDMTTLIND